ncbi:hypothetical protein B0T18DRAFT_409103 [Schizothecium vesticola]|uniref:Uncharacterized protein n=1 Tax=Schizothecium vesticola TaxID=314040 RepID=A0AA40K997_9PEZI|nr:hypothetical protein B0T18DRAFT_409103 [Schizothecium vesticola]
MGEVGALRGVVVVTWGVLLEGVCCLGSSLSLSRVHEIRPKTASPLSSGGREGKGKERKKKKKLHGGGGNKVLVVAHGGLADDTQVPISRLQMREVRGWAHDG